jgi:hypothetical protein
MIHPGRQLASKHLWQAPSLCYNTRFRFREFSLNDSQLSSLKTWFDEYVKGFYGIDSVIDANVELKEHHTRNTCGEVQAIVEAIDLSHNQRLIAETVALFHDLGRFEQFRDYRTFVDSVSLNHGCHSAHLVQKLGLLKDLPLAEQEVICTAIRLHNVKALPDGLSGDVLLYARIIRDADKMDIFRVFHHYYELLRDDPESFKANLDLPVTDDYTRSVLDNLLTRQPIAYSMLRTSTDVTLLHLQWIYDINFVASLKRIKERGHLAELVSHLPDDENIRSAVNTVFGYLDRQVASATILAAGH